MFAPIPAGPPVTYSVSIDELPHYWMRNRTHPVADIADCLSSFIINFKALWKTIIRRNGFQQVLIMPSFEQMSRYFLCAHEEMLAALKELEKRHGIVFELVGNNSPVLIYLFYNQQSEHNKLAS